MPEERKGSKIFENILVGALCTGLLLLANAVTLAIWGFYEKWTFMVLVKELLTGLVYIGVYWLILWDLYRRDRLLVQLPRVMVCMGVLTMLIIHMILLTIGCFGAFPEILEITAVQGILLLGFCLAERYCTRNIQIQDDPDDNDMQGLPPERENAIEWLARNAPDMLNK